MSAPSRQATQPDAGADAPSVLNALPDAILVLDSADRIVSLNVSAEQFFAAGKTTLGGQALSDLLPADSPVFGILAQARRGSYSVSESDMLLETPRIGSRFVEVAAAPIPEPGDRVVLSLKERSIARKLDHQLGHRNAARSVSAMAAMLAHEVKNPLSGIRGAAQLIEQTADSETAGLTRLICEEADRIVALVDRMDSFADDRPIERGAVNIHEVLEHVRRVAQAGFARQLRFVESYDPSLPPVLGNRDLLVQVFLNLVKNAAEAVDAKDGEILLDTRYRHGVRLAVPGGGARVDLPLTVTVGDNGGGIPADMISHLFDPFVTSKTEGRGLGLALVAKIVNNHGGVIEAESEPRRTRFRIMLPVSPDAGTRRAAP